MKRTTKPRKKLSIGAIAFISSVSKSVVEKMKQRLDKGDEESFKRILGGNCLAMRVPVLPFAEYQLLFKPLLFCASRGAALYMTHSDI